MPTASNYIASTNPMNTMMNQSGLGATTNPFSNPSTGAAPKPYSDYQPPSGYSPWQLLNQSTQNGTVNPYTTFVQPAIQQQNFNSHMSEQINGVMTSPRYNTGTPGVEVPMGSNGMANPQIFQNYKNY